jgi:uncharacterized protein (TIGR02145 family)
VAEEEIREVGVQSGVAYICTFTLATEDNELVIKASIIDVETAHITNSKTVVCLDRTNRDDIIKKCESLPYSLLGISHTGGTTTSSGGGKQTETASPNTTDKGVVINGVRWATRNVGAHGQFVAKPEEFGGYYQWGRKGDGHEKPTSKTTTTLSTTNTPTHGNFIKNDNDPYDWRTPQNDNLWGATKTANDPCPCGWRVPTGAELASLVNSTTSWGDLNGTNGRFFGSGENTIFLPAAGYRNVFIGLLLSAGTHGDYWSSTPDYISVYYLYFDSGTVNPYNLCRVYGFSVRCVAE